MKHFVINMLGTRCQVWCMFAFKFILIVGKSLLSNVYYTEGERLNERHFNLTFNLCQMLYNSIYEIRKEINWEVKILNCGFIKLFPSLLNCGRKFK